MRATNATKDSMCCIRRGTILLVFPPNSMPFKQDSIPSAPQPPILRAIANSWIVWAFRSIGTVKYVLPTPSITAGHSGYFYNFLMLTTIKSWIKRAPSMRLSHISKYTETKIFPQRVPMTFQYSMRNNGRRSLQKNNNAFSWTID